MKILITGTSGLAANLAQVYQDHLVRCVSCRTGHDINRIKEWGEEFHLYDMVINCADSQGGQLHLLEYFFNLWHQDAKKTIVTIGSRIINYPRTDHTQEYWPYRINKMSLQNAHDMMLITAQCRMIIFNPGPIDTAMMSHQTCKKISPQDLATKMRVCIEDTTIRRVDLWV